MALARWKLDYLWLFWTFVTFYTINCQSLNEIELNGQVFSGKGTLTSGQYRVTNDIIVEPEGELTIEAGSRLLFNTGVGITVRGVLRANGREGKRIIMTRSVSYTDGNVKGPGTIRLVDGPTIFAGRLQMNENGRWFSVCTNSRNWTEADLHVACQELGFRGGYFYKWFDHNPDAAQLLYENPQCHPSHQSLSMCVRSHTKKFGSGVCDDHLDLGIQCDPQPVISSYNWKGIHFENALTYKTSPERSITLTISKSSLDHVDILHAGYNRTGNLTDALNVIGVPPVMQYLTIRGSASNAINITSSENLLDIRHSTIEKNRGYGIFINSSSGNARVHNCRITNNGADGVRYVHHDHLMEPISLADLCATPSLDVQTYPVRFYVKQEAKSKNITCDKSFAISNSREPLVLTVHFLYWMASVDGAGSLEIRDGDNERAKELFTYKISNSSRPESITTFGNLLWIQFKAIARSTVYLTIEIEASLEKPFDLKVSNSFLDLNNGRGIAIENIRSALLVQGCEILRHNHVAGVHVLNGSGDVNITSTVIKNNTCDGVNISYAGGRQNFTMMTVLNNHGRGVAIWYNESSLYKFASQYLVFYRSYILDNLDYGVLVGNFCGDSLVNVTQTMFKDGQNVGLKIDSCWSKQIGIRHVYVTNNKFDKNRLSGLVMEPAVNVRVYISNNQFVNHEVSALFIQNEAREEFEKLTAYFNISENKFEHNKGHFVAGLGLCQHGRNQEMFFTYNVLQNNMVSEPFPQFNPRSKVAAVVTIGSNNVVVYRNSFNDPNSTYELGSHLAEPYSNINASHNFLGQRDRQYVNNRIFDYKYRYNIAPIIHMPFLSSDNDLYSFEYLETEKALPENFRQGNVIGGELNRGDDLSKGEYRVIKDIVIKENGDLKIAKGSTVRFAKSVGILIHGKVTAGYQWDNPRSNDGVTFTLLDEPNLNADVSRTVRLVNGKSKYEGRLQVSLNGKWGTVCNYGWTMLDASLACHQMGLVLNPDDWILEPAEMLSGFDYGQPIHLSNVRCGVLDTDITKCRAEAEGYFKNSCSHDNDVGIKCYEQGWAGVRVSLLAKGDSLRDIRIDRAGLLDPNIDALQPALQVDLANFDIEKVTITRSVHTGLGVVFGNPYFGWKIRECTLERNRGNGLIVHSQGLWLENCQINDNEASGVHFNPVLSREGERNLVEWINVGNEKKVRRLEGNEHVRLNRDQGMFFVTSDQQNVEATFSIEGGADDWLQILVIGAPHRSSTADLTVLDGPVKIDIRQNLTRFPYATSHTKVTLKYRSGPKPVGKVAVHITPFEKIAVVPTPTLRIHHCDISRNNEGVSVYHYNSIRSKEVEWNDRYLRTKNESIEIMWSKIHDNLKEGLSVVTPHHESQTFELANITYLINETYLEGNKRGAIVQVSRDIRNSNNVFQWIIGGSTITGNEENGVDLIFPYVWQSKLDETHSLYLQNNSLKYNKNFKFSVSGFYANVYIRENNFSDNACKKGLISVAGMEKQMFVELNDVRNNTCHFMVEFDINSHSDLSSHIPAYFKNNLVRYNRHISKVKKTEADYQPNSYTIALRGVQKVNITNNVFDRNQMEYELLAGIRTSSLDNSINVRENWWGTPDVMTIHNRIFDFDDWNSFAIADFSSYLLQASFSAGSQHTGQITPVPVNAWNLGGRMFTNLKLVWRDKPYIVRTDLTIMPGYTLYIEPGVEIQFYPSVGILVLGALKASGTSLQRISMTPYSGKDSYYFSNGRYKRAFPSVKKDEVRLCTKTPCEVGSTHGFVEVFNVSTIQWTPLCDKRFTERNAEVVCQQLGHHKLNAFVKFGPRLDVDPTYISRIRTWPEPRQCSGSEQNYLDCPVRLNGDFRHTYFCPHTADFVYVYCGERNLHKDHHYWGGIRFASPNYERKVGYPYDKIPNTVRIQDSVLEYVDVIGAGVLHNEKSGAVQAIFNVPSTMEYINVTRSASHGINLISPLIGVNLIGNRITENLGVGINIMELNGYIGNRIESDFTPLKFAHVPYNAFGFVDICESHKVLEVDQRVVVYYRYYNHPTDCVKIFKSKKRVSQLGFRLLQFNLFNSTGDTSTVDSLRVFEGDIYNASVTLLGEFNFQSDNTKSFLRSNTSTLSVQLHASGATEEHGFIAEIIILPSLGIGKERQHNITYSVISNNYMGGIVYSSTGDSNPPAMLAHNQIKANGIGMFGNFTSCEAAINFDIRNTKSIIVLNNLLSQNQGGLAVITEATSAGNRLTAEISLNLITGNLNRNALSIIGNDEVVSKALLTDNYITQNVAEYEDIIVVKMIYLSFVRNYVRKNTGRHTLAVYGYENQQFQTVEYSNIFENTARTPEYRATIYAGGSGQNYENNVLINLDNDYEIITRDRSIDLGESYAIDATSNWWGNDFQKSAIDGRIRDRHDVDNLLEVIYEPYLLNNISLVNGKCLPGWSGIGKTCYIYVGGVMTNEEAKRYCISEESALPYLTDANESELRKLITKKQANINFQQRVWILSLDRPAECVSYASDGTERTWCDERLPFLCESDPDIHVVPFLETLTIAIISVSGAAILLVLLCVLFWVCKSRRRQKERLERRNSIRASKRSLRSISSGSLPSDTNSSCRRILGAQHGKAIKMVEAPYKGSFDSIEKAPSRFDSSSYFNSSIEDNQSYEICEAANHKVEYSDFEDRYEDESRPAERTLPPNPILHPSYEFGYDNKAFTDNAYPNGSDPQPWSSSSTSESTADIKRYLETSLDTNGRDETYTSRSTPSTYSQEMPNRKQLLETDM